MSLDLTFKRASGMHWDFSVASNRKAAIEMIRETKPYLIIGSPPCTAWSMLQHLGKNKPGHEERLRRDQEQARVHLEFCALIYIYIYI